MVSVWRQLRLLLWKGMMVKKRQKTWLFIELAVPIILFLFLALVRRVNFDVPITTCHFNSKALPSAGLLPFLNSFFCSFANECHLTPTNGDEQQEINQIGNESGLITATRDTVALFRSIGENPVMWGRLLNDLIELIHIIAGLKPSNNTINGTRVKIGELFASDEAAMFTFHSIGFDSNTSMAITNAHMTPTVLKFFALQGIRILSNGPNDFNFFDENCTAQLNNSLITEDSELVAKICDFSVIDLMFSEPNFTQIDMDIIAQQMAQLLSSYTGREMDGNLTRTMVSLYKDISSNNELMSLWKEWKNFSNTSLVNWIACGNVEEMNAVSGGGGFLPGPSSSLNDDDMSALKRDGQKMMAFLQSVTPGGEEILNHTCGDIPIRKDSNCSTLEGYVLRKVRPMLEGYILVTPNAPIVQEIVEELNSPLQDVNVLRDSIYLFNEYADPFQDAISRSDLHNATEVMIDIIHRLNATWGPLPDQVNKMVDLLDNLFNNSTDHRSLLPMMKNVTETVADYFRCISLDRFIIVETESEMERMAVCLMEVDQYFTGIVFDVQSGANDLRPLVNYKIRHHPDLIDGTNGQTRDSTKNRAPRSNPMQDLKYLTFGFSFLQDAIDRVLIRKLTNETVNTGIYTQQQPMPCGYYDSFNVIAFLSLFVILSWMIPAALLVKNIVYEKEQRLKEMMRIMGLGDMIHWVAWAAQSLAMNLLSLVIICLLLKFGRILPSTDLSLLMTVLVMFSVTSICQCLFLSTLFSKANIGTAVTAVVFFLFFFPFQLTVRSRSYLGSLLSLLLPQTGIGYAFTMIANADREGAAQWADVPRMRFNSDNPKEIHLVQVMFAFVVSSVLYVLSAWYISAVFPGSFGIARPWFFFLTAKYWCGQKEYNNDGEKEEIEFLPDHVAVNHEAEPKGLKMAVEIRNMVKVYNNATKAIDCLNVRFFESQITSFLGHNGAGKTTTMSILTGIYPPSSGTAFVYDLDIRTEIAQVRKELGVCPQHNILFNLLNVEEQLRFYAGLKGVPSKRLNEEVNTMIVDIGLDSKRQALAAELSGGMKRKLSIGIALIGGSRLVILDEPTAGIDAHARRSIWQLLLKYKEGRTIILSTHHMDEADVLGDRIVMIAEGQLRASGSSLFLKKRFGNGYHLTLLKQNNMIPPPSPRRAIDEMEKFIRAHAEDAQLVEHVGDEVVFTLPLTMPADRLQILFSSLDRAMTNLGIATYGVSAPSLQQIFLRVAPMSEQKLKKAHGRCDCMRGLFRRTHRLNDSDNVNLLTAVDGSAMLGSNRSGRHEHPKVVLNQSRFIVLAQKTKALFAKRWHNAKRTKKAMACELFLPILLLLACELYVKSQSNGSPERPTGLTLTVSQPSVGLVPWLYGDRTFHFVSSMDMETNSTAFAYGESLFSDPGLGVRCVKDSPFDCHRGSASGQLDLAMDQREPFTYPLGCCCQTEYSEFNCSLNTYPMGDINNFTLNTTDYILDLSYRNLSQFTLVFNYRDTMEHNLVFVGGWGLGHVNRKAMRDGQVEAARTGLDTLLFYMKKAMNVWGIDFERGNETALIDPFDENRSLVEVMKSTFSSLDARDNVKVWFSNKLWHALPIEQNLIYNGILRAQLPIGIERESVGLHATNHPMNKTIQQTFDDTNSVDRVVMFRVVLLILALTLIPASFSMILVEERQSFSKHLQQVSGVPPWLYWITNFIWDMVMLSLIYLFILQIIFELCIAIILLLFWAMDVGEYNLGLIDTASLILVYNIYGLCTIPFIYVLQKPFSIPAVAYLFIGIGLFFVGVVTTMITLVLEQQLQTDESLRNAYTITGWIFIIVPQYNLGLALSRMGMLYQIFRAGKNYLAVIERLDLVDQLPLPSPLVWHLMGKHTLFLFIQACIAMIVLVIMEYHQTLFKVFRQWERRRTKNQLDSIVEFCDEDVLAEQQRVAAINNDEMEQYGIVVRRLAKSYNNELMAVKGVSFAVERGHCFGLLGVNGAGKTTTFGMLTQAVSVGLGDAFIHGHSVSSSSASGLRLLGYCPQFDALNLKLTAREQLTFYCRVRGIPESSIKAVVDWAINSMQLRAYADEISASFSGGNKRKLSAAIALVADPPVVLLDEPSAGMDPSSQQFMWELIAQLRRENRTVLITSHSMEECEVLCTRLAIMVAGQLHCIGSLQHLKQKFGGGYTLTMKLTHTNQVEEARQFVENHLSFAQLEAVHCSTLFFRIRSSVSTVAETFQVISELQKLISVDDYSLSQTTLDEVFVSFAMKDDSLTRVSTVSNFAT